MLSSTLSRYNTIPAMAMSLRGPSGDSRRLSKLKVTSYDTDYIRNRNSFQSGHFFEAAPARVNSNKAFVSRITTGVSTSLDSALCQVSVFVLLY